MRTNSLVFLLFSASVAVGFGCAPPRLASVSQMELQPAQVAFRDISVFDGIAMQRHRDVVVSDSIIQSIGGTGSLGLPAGASVIEGAGLTLLPGLIDSHVHFMSAGEKESFPPSAEAIGKAFLFAGVTTVLATAGGDETVDLIEGIRAGEILAPHVYFAGPGLTAPGGHPKPLLRAMLPWPLSRIAANAVPSAANADEARAQVKRIVREIAPDYLKIIYDDLPPGSPHLSRQALDGAIDEARSQGVAVIVHANTAQDTLDALAAGAALMVHVPQREALDDAQIEQVVASAVPFVTTVRLISASHDLSDRGPGALERAAIEDSMLAKWQAEPRWGLRGFSEEVDRRHEEIAAMTQENLQRFHAAGVPLLVGTDSGVHGVFPGVSLHLELGLLVELGLTPIEVLRAATSIPADFLEAGGGFGRIARGQRADLLLVRGDPSSDITALSNIEEVFLAGVQLDRHPVE